MNTLPLTLDIIVTDADLPVLGGVANWLSDHPLLVVAVIVIMLAAIVHFVARRSLGRLDGASSRGSRALYLVPLLVLTSLWGLSAVDALPGEMWPQNLFNNNTSATAASNLVLGVDNSHLSIKVNKNATASSASGSTISTTSITGAGSAGYKLSTKLSVDDDTTTVVQETGIELAIIEADGTVKNYDATNNADIALDTSLDITSRTIVATVPASILMGTYTLSIVYEAEDNAIPNPQVCKNADPNSSCKVDLDANMIPLKYSGDTSAPVWQVANPAELGEWYDYENQQWANVATVDNPAAYRTPGTVVPESSILGYYVYIPRYAYQVCRPNASDPITGITAPGCPNDISFPYNFNIQFQTANQTTSFDGVTVGDWATHPAFTQAGNSNGFWYGKYESSRSDGWFCYAVNCNNQGDTASGTGMPLTSINPVSSYATVLPNRAPALRQRVSYAYLSARNIATAHGLASATSTLSNNYFWGAVSYLSTSIYGVAARDVPTNSAPSGKKVANNSYITSMAANSGTSSRYITGAGPQANTYTDDYAAGVNNQYYGEIGQKASSTGNVYGIYDLAGGVNEYQLAVLTCSVDSVLSTGDSFDYNSGFSDGSTNCYQGVTFATNPTDYAGAPDGQVAWPNSSWMNIYSSATVFTNDYASTSNNQCTWWQCGGQALHETKAVMTISGNNNTESWGADYSNFINSHSSWFVRGSQSLSGLNAGIWATDTNFGGASNFVGWRAVLLVP